MTIKGNIIYVDLAGGFWGIQGEDGSNYQPVAPLPEVLQKPGLLVKARVEFADVFSIFMWGEPVHILEIQPV